MRHCLLLYTTAPVPHEEARPGQDLPLDILTGGDNHLDGVIVPSIAGGPTLPYGEDVNLVADFLYGPSREVPMLEIALKPILNSILPWNALQGETWGHR